MKTLKEYLIEAVCSDYSSVVTERKPGKLTFRITKVNDDNEWYIADVSTNDHEFRIDSITYPNDKEVERGSELRKILTTRILRDIREYI